MEEGPQKVFHDQSLPKFGAGLESNSCPLDQQSESTDCTTGHAFSDANFAGTLRVMPVFKQNLWLMIKKIIFASYLRLLGDKPLPPLSGYLLSYCPGSGSGPVPGGAGGGPLACGGVCPVGVLLGPAGGNP